MELWNFKSRNFNLYGIWEIGRDSVIQFLTFRFDRFKAFSRALVWTAADDVSTVQNGQVRSRIRLLWAPNCSDNWQKHLTIVINWLSDLSYFIANNWMTDHASQHLYDIACQLAHNYKNLGNGSVPINTATLVLTHLVCLLYNGTSTLSIVFRLLVPRTVVIKRFNLLKTIWNWQVINIWT